MWSSELGLDILTVQRELARGPQLDSRPGSADSSVGAHPRPLPVRTGARAKSAWRGGTPGLVSLQTGRQAEDTEQREPQKRQLHPPRFQPRGRCWEVRKMEAGLKTKDPVPSVYF